MNINMIFFWLIAFALGMTLLGFNLTKYRTEKAFCEEQEGAYEFGGFIGIYSDCIIERNGEFIFYQIRGNKDKMVLVKNG